MKEKEMSAELRLLRRQNDGRYLKLTFAMPAHEGSVRCIDVASSSSPVVAPSAATAAAAPGDVDVVVGPGAILSGGYDESMNVYDLKGMSQVGELRTPSDLGAPLCCSFAPPSNRVRGGTGGVGGGGATHAVVGTASGKVVIYRRKDWSVQHVLSGHDAGGAGCIAVHPTGRMALSGGRSDGRLILWDLVKGRLAYVHRIPPPPPKRVGGGGTGGGNRRRDAINHVVWSDDGSRYAYCHGSRIVARDATTGEDLLDVDMSPCPRVNQVAFVGGPEGMFLAAACDDGGLPVLEVGRLPDGDDDDDEGEGGSRQRNRGRTTTGARGGRSWP